MVNLTNYNYKIRQKIFNIFGSSFRIKLRNIYIRFLFLKKNGFQYLNLSKFQLVEGFLEDNEAICLYKLTKNLRAKNPCIVEIGSYLGKSATVFASALKKNSNATINCIDPFNGIGEDRSIKRYQSDLRKLKISQLDKFKQNICNFGNPKITNIFQGLSNSVVKDWNKKIDLLFVDGNHAYEAVKQDYEDWSVFISKGGYLVFHDTWFEAPKDLKKKWQEGPGKVVKESLIGNEKWEKIAYVKSLYCLRKI